MAAPMERSWAQLNALLEAGIRDRSAGSGRPSRPAALQAQAPARSAPPGDYFIPPLSAASGPD
jgi:hypothetical protein